MQRIATAVFQRLFLCFLICTLPAGQAFAAMSDEEFFELCIIGSEQQIVDAIQNGANVHARDEIGQTPLIRAAFGNPNPEVTITLIQAGADVNACDKEGYTPLILAVLSKKANLKVITALINAGADVNEQNIGGRTPLMEATEERSNLEVLTVLVQAGADVNASHI